MKHFLHSLAARSIGEAGGVQPRLPARFEPPQGLQLPGLVAQKFEDADDEREPTSADESPQGPESSPIPLRPVSLLAERGTPETFAVLGNPQPDDRSGPPARASAWPRLETPAQPGAHSTRPRGAAEAPVRAQPAQDARPSANGEGGRQGAVATPTEPEMPPGQSADHPATGPATFIERTIERVVMERGMPPIEQAGRSAEATGPRAAPPPGSPRSWREAASPLDAAITPVRPRGEADRPAVGPIVARMAEWPTAQAFASERTIRDEPAAPSLHPTPRPLVAESAVARWGEQLAGPAPAATIEPAPPAPTIHVSIGRVEVRATPQASAPARQRQASAAPSLDDYLRQRTRGGGG